MIITTLLLLSFLGVFSVSKRHLNKYFLFTSLLVSLHAIFFIPPIDYDLSRHLDLINQLSNMSLSEVHDKGEMVEYYLSSRVYLYIAFLFSKIPIYNGITVFVTFMVFYLFSFRIYKIGVELSIRNWKLALCLFFVLSTLDFRSIYGVRNILAYALLAYVLYEDLVNKKNGIICCILYFLLAGIHTAVYPIIGLRYFLLLQRFLSFKLLAFSILMSYPLVSIIIEIFASFSSIPIFSILALKIINYSESGTQYNVIFALFRGIIMISITSVVWFVSHYHIINPKFKNLARLFFLIVFYTFSAVSQYDLFIRNELLILFLSIPFILQFYKSFLTTGFLRLKINKDKFISFLGATIYFFHILLIFCSFFYYVTYRYLELDMFFH